MLEEQSTEPEVKVAPSPEDIAPEQPEEVVEEVVPEKPEEVTPVVEKVAPPPKAEKVAPPPKGFVPEQPEINYTNVATQPIPLNMEMQSDLGKKYGFDADVETMDPPKEWLDLDEEGNIIKDGPKQVEWASEVHNNWLAGEEYQNMVKHDEFKSIPPYDPAKVLSELENEKFIQRRDQEDPEASAWKHVSSKILSESVMGKTSAFLTGAIYAAGDPNMSAVDYYRDIMDQHATNISMYQPTEVQSIASGLMVISADLGLFSGLGGVYSKTGKAIATTAGFKAASKYVKNLLVKRGLPEILAERHVMNAISKVNQAAQPGFVLGTHYGMGDVPDQIAKGANWKDLDWGQAFKGSTRMGIVGVGIGGVGVGTSVLKGSKYMDNFINGGFKKKFAEKGIDALGFVSEVSVFTYGDALLNSEQDIRDIGTKEWIHSFFTILGLKAMHPGHKPLEGRGMFTGIEVKGLSKHVNLKNTMDPLKKIVGEGKLQDILNDPNQSFRVKQEIAKAYDIELPAPPLDRAYLNEKTLELKTYSKDGVLLDIQQFGDKGQGLRKLYEHEVHINEMRHAKEFSEMPQEAIMDIQKRLEKVLDKGYANGDLNNAFLTPKSVRTPDQNKAMSAFLEKMREHKQEQSDKLAEKYPDLDGAKKLLAEGEMLTEGGIKKIQDRASEVKRVKELGEVSKAIEEQQRTQPYTERDVELKFGLIDDLLATKNNPKNGMEPKLKELDAIDAKGEYTDAIIRSKSFPDMFGTSTDALKIKNAEHSKEVRTKIENRLKDVNTELKTRVGKPSVPSEKFQLGSQGYPTKVELFKDLSRIPDLEKNMPSTMDISTVNAIKEFKTLKKQRAEEFTGVKEPTVPKLAEGLSTAAEYLRKNAKGKLDPEAGTLQMRLPGMEKAWDAGVEVVAKSLEGGAQIVEAINKGIANIRTSVEWKGATRAKQLDLEQKFREDMARMTDEQITKQVEGIEKAKQYTKDIDRVKSEDPNKFWTVDRPSDKVISKAADTGKLLEVEGGKAIVKPDGEIVGVIKTDPKVEGVGKPLMKASIEAGGTKLNNFSDITPVYEKAGFKKVAEVPFNPKRAPKDMPKGEDFVPPKTVDFMVYDPKGEIPKSDLNKKSKTREEAEAHWNSVNDVLYAPEPAAPKPKKKPKTALQKKSDKQYQRQRTKVLVDEYTALKDQIKVEGKTAKIIQKNTQEAREAMNEFISSQAWAGTMNRRAAKAIWRRVNEMDFTKPGTIEKAKEYIEKAVNDANFRAELAEFDAAYTKLDKFTDLKTYDKRDPSGIIKGKGIDVGTRDRLKKLRESMIKDDPFAALEKTEKIWEKIDAENREITLKEFEAIEDLAFAGLMRSDHKGSIGEYNARVNDLKEIIKKGRTQRQAEHAVWSEKMAEKRALTDRVVSARMKAIMDPAERANTELGRKWYEPVGSKLDWVMQDSWFSALDKISSHDKSSAPMRSDINKEFGGGWIKAEHNHIVSRDAKYAEAVDGMAKIFGVKPKKVLNKLNSFSKDLHNMEWVETSLMGNKTNKSAKLTQGEAAYMWGKMRDLTIRGNLINDGYFDRAGNPTTKHNALEKILTPEAKELTDFWIDFANKSYDNYNPTYRRRFGRDMPRIDNYLPISISDSKATPDLTLMSDPNVRNMVSNNHLKARTNHKKSIAVMDINTTMMSYIEKMEYFKGWADYSAEVNSVFGNEAIRQSIKQNFGQKNVDNIDYFLKKFATGRAPMKMNDFERAMDGFRKRFVVGSLIGKGNLTGKQLTSFPAYADQIPVKDFVAGLGDFALNFKKATSTLNTTPYMKDRINKGWDRDVKLAMQKNAAKMFSGSKQASMQSIFMFPIKFGDIAAINIGGWSVYKHHYDKAIKNNLGVEQAKSIAEIEFVRATRSSQQATGLADMSQFQDGNFMFKFMTMYKTSPFLYHRKVMEASRGLVYGRGSKSENIKKLVIYHAILPSLFQLASNGFKWDGEDQLRAAIVGNFNAPFALGDGVNFIADRIQGKPFGYKASPVESAISAIPHIAADMKEVLNYIQNPDQITVGDYLEATKDLARWGSLMTGTIASPLHNTVHTAVDALEGNSDYLIRRIIGYSENALEGGTDLLPTPFNKEEKYSPPPPTSTGKSYQKKVAPPPK